LKVCSGFQKRSCSNNKLKRDDDSENSHRALAPSLSRHAARHEIRQDNMISRIEIASARRADLTTTPAQLAAVAPLRIGAQRAISALSRVSSLSGPRSFGSGIRPPSLTMRSRTPRSLSVSSSARLSRATTGCGVPFGAKIALQMLIL